ncbi:DUF2281 domain-containing protein [Aphanothece sacrum]|uniref:DUF2281 domain-containing protein n=1 Tax=Aphanothece sacrum FPU1 TaxID=1920663 RepID=A0A401IK32_APHSA|nr:DUF2281 domain-containing protein [Aphanothece sacrum]GBF81637.1 hypothetical protein AsFPU1_3055 [Aphanothece sacrum FPU1]GBF84104.1 hypothetical protein AsFPU3_1150 [Aphanothece sacrum FPU3]
MNIEQTVIKYLRKLPPDKQQEVLDFTQFLNQKMTLPQPDTTLTPEEKIAKWNKFIAKLPQNSANLPDEALHRDTMYEDEY